MLLQVPQDALQVFRVVGGDAKEGRGMVVLVAAHAEPQNAVLTAALEDVVEHLGEQQGVDDVALELDVFVCTHAEQYT